MRSVDNVGVPLLVIANKQVSIFLKTATKGRFSYYLCVEYFFQLSFDSEVNTKSATAADFVYISESTESWEKLSA